MRSMWFSEQTSNNEDFSNYNSRQFLGKPKLLRSLCIESSTIRSFLKRSRLYADDTFREKLNSQRRNKSCVDVVNNILMPLWAERLEVIQYCGQEAMLLRKEIAATNKVTPEKREFDLRVNPYAVEDFENEQNQKFERLLNLENWLKNESIIEKIVVDKSLGTLADNCPNVDVDRLKANLKSNPIVS